MMAILSFNELINSTCIMKDIKPNSLYFSYKYLKRRLQLKPQYVTETYVTVENTQFDWWG